MTVNTNNMIKDACLSSCEQYRYELRRTWDEDKPKVLFIMLNPSTADSEVDDPTITRCINYAKDWGFGGILVGNLFAYRSTNPTGLLTVQDPIGDDNIWHIKNMYYQSDVVVCAWGNTNIVNRLEKKIKYDYRPLSVITNRLYCLELSNNGTPKHPLQLKKHLKLIDYDTKTKTK